MKFATVFPNFEHIHLTKDVGMIPAAISGYKNIDVFVLYWNRNDNNNIENIYGDKFHVVSVLAKNKFMFFLKAILYIINNGITHVHMFHLKKESYFMAFIIRALRKNFYLKMDIDGTRFPDFLNQITNSKSIKSYILRFFLKFPNIFSCENRQFYNKLILLDVFSKSLVYLPNGILSSSIPVCSIQESSALKNTILVVSRFGDFQKNTELILKALEAVEDLHGWNFKFIGPSTKEFLMRLDVFNNSDFPASNSVEYLGLLSRKQIFDLYSSSKVFLISSRWEGFSLAMVEATYMGMYLISTEIEGVRDVTDNGLLGSFYESDNSLELEVLFRELFSGHINIDFDFKRRIDFVRSNFSLDESIHIIGDRL